MVSIRSFYVENISLIIYLKILRKENSPRFLVSEFKEV